MKIIEKRRSLERCTESGWDAVDLILDEPMDDDFIMRFKRIEGSFIYLSMLKNPFFKVENHNYILKGVKGNDFFRVAMHRDYIDKVSEFVEILND